MKLVLYALVAAITVMRLTAGLAGQAEGDAAFQAKNYTEAFREWKSLAEDREAKAQNGTWCIV
ncbi:hypothetical protein LJR231_005185 [Phyllobacterium sp. LjRoot231]|uniref:hypothetical protein n=1 Tax=Phyllobacterium sp. LjRoot231 TaxID=3342289 RepID=UPI003ECD9C98